MVRPVQRLPKTTNDQNTKHDKNENKPTRKKFWTKKTTSNHPGTEFKWSDDKSAIPVNGEFLVYTPPSPDTLLKYNTTPDTAADIPTPVISDTEEEEEKEEDVIEKEQPRENFWTDENTSEHPKTEFRWIDKDRAVPVNGKFLVFTEDSLTNHTILPCAPDTTPDVPTSNGETSHENMDRFNFSERATRYFNENKFGDTILPLPKWAGTGSYPVYRTAKPTYTSKLEVISADPQSEGSQRWDPTNAIEWLASHRGYIYTQIEPHYVIKVDPTIPRTHGMDLPGKG